MSASDSAPVVTGGAPHARLHPGPRPRQPLSAAAWRAARRWLYFFHRWTGIALCVLFAIWFVSGVVMMYVPFPSFRAPERIASAPPIDWAQVRVRPEAALATLDEATFPSEMRIGMTAGEPVYRFVTKEGRRAVSAVTGREILSVDAGRAGTIASALVHAPVEAVTPVDNDQWVVTGAYKKMAPFWRVRLADTAATDIYVTQKTGEIVQNTTAHERFWNWLGAVPHWIYFTALRLHQEPWRQTVLWTSGIGMVGAVAGVWIGLLRVRLSKRYKSGSVSPYRGWMKWHHVTGLVGGLAVLTWVFSGWMSMSPWGGLRDADHGIAERYSGDRHGFAPTDLAALKREAHGAREVTFAYLGAKPVMIALGAARDKVLLDGATARPLALPTSRIEAIARAAVTDGKLVSVHRLTSYDRYWYTTGDPRSDARPLPVLRLTFDDPARTWLHVDPATGMLLGRMGSGSRSYRWLFAALHSFDLPWLLTWRPLRDGLMWVLSGAGLAISVTGIVVGWRHLRPAKRRRAKPR
ncbi:PepSY domain-containing protein [Novosphingobium sp. P6W]|uniref:PepSY domain-containing protein n=1 Tax=Novosphingobium sp. P6W TaxID=1609758 RepID=UPI000695F230|nr:PepSY domain-containing protein [Novosphingobium sp. P6W]AXB79173.1 PepSY domain-containing protein [Novosphingobium sp. P6W]